MVPITCNEVGDCVACYITEILDCYSKLSQSLDLKPSPKINGVFERLVNLCKKVHSETIASQVCRIYHAVNVDYLPDMLGTRSCRTPKLLA